MSERSTEDNYSELVKIAKGLADSEVVFRGTFVNFTPWWGGNYKGRVLEVEGKQNPSHAYVTLPEAKSITGKTVWFLRTVKGDNFLKEIGIVDDVKERRRSKVSVVVRGQPVRVDLNSGRASDKDVLYLKKKDLGGLKDAMRSVKGKSFKLCSSRRTEGTTEGIEDFLSVFCIPRVLLRVRDILNEVYKESAEFRKHDTALLDVISMLPVKPRAVSFDVEVRAERDAKDLAVEFTKGLLFTLYYLGVGNGANRGFGRFKLVSTGKVSGGISTDPKKVLESFSPFNRDDSFPSYKGMEQLGRMNGKVEKVLKCVGEATTKVKWKSDPRSCGKNLNTWVLGLPRKGKDNIEENKEKRIEGCKNIDSEDAKKVAGEYFDGVATVERKNVNVISGYSFFIGKPEVSRRQSYVVLSVNEEGGGYVIYAFKFIPDKPDTEVVTKGLFVGLHGHQNRNCKVEVEDVLNGVNGQKLNQLISDAMNKVKNYLKVCNTQGGSTQGISTGRGQKFGEPHKDRYTNWERRGGR